MRTEARTDRKVNQENVTSEQEKRQKLGRLYLKNWESRTESRVMAGTCGGESAVWR